MARGVTTALNTQLTSASLRPFFAVNLDFSGGAFATWTGYGDITFDSTTFIGTGELLNIDGLRESSAVQADGVTIVLNGLDSALVSAAITENYQGRKATIYVGTISDAGSVTSDPYKVFIGRMDTMSIHDDGERATIAMACENRLIELNRNKVRRFTNEDQKSEFANDVGMEFVSSLQEKAIRWGL